MVDEPAVRLGGKGQLGDAGDDQGIEEPREEGEEGEDDEGGLDLPDGRGLNRFRTRIQIPPIQGSPRLRRGLR